MLKKRFLRMLLLCCTMAVLLSAGTTAVKAMEAEEMEGGWIEGTEVELQSADLEQDPSDLLMWYLEKEAGVFPEAELMAEAGDHLTGLEKALYNTLKAVVKEIAAGKRQSTEIEILPSELGYSLTKSDISVSDADKRDSIVKELLQPLLDTVIGAICADCPYDLYWRAKSPYWSASGESSTKISTVTVNGKISFTYSVTVNKIVVRFRVGPNYQGTDAYTVKSDLETKISTVKYNAKAIVDANESKSDYEKLKAYKDEICELVVYDKKAAENSSDPNYDSDPWQLMYVFDGNLSTNVVCEGYAKAFQFLCDLSTFTTSDFACYQVWGMAAGPGAEVFGGHAWNHVTLNGQTYMVDVTFCDTGLPYDFMAYALSGKNTKTTGYAIPDPSNPSRTAQYTDIDAFNGKNFYDKDAPFLTLSTEAYREPFITASVSALTLSVGESRTITITASGGLPSPYSFVPERSSSSFSYTWSGDWNRNSHDLTVSASQVGDGILKVYLLDATTQNRLTSVSIPITIVPAVTPTPTPTITPTPSPAVTPVITATVSSLAMTVGESRTITISASGGLPAHYTFQSSRSNSNFKTDWPGDWYYNQNNKISHDLTITAQQSGNSILTVSLRDTDLNESLTSISIPITITPVVTPTPTPTITPTPTPTITPTPRPTITPVPSSYRINDITLSNEAGNTLQAIPSGSFLVTLSVTNLTWQESPVIFLASYTEQGKFQGLMYVTVEALPDTTVKVTLPVENPGGNIAQLKAFAVASFADMKPLGSAVSFPAA